MDKPVIAQPVAIMVEVEEGETYWWCACGRSQNQPYCDGSHQGTGFEPVEYTPDRTRKIMLCGCKATKHPPICDGAHNLLDA